MKKKLHAIVLVIIIYSCSTDKGKIIISNIDKAKILNEILSDTIDLKLLPYQNVFISDCNFLPKIPSHVIEKGDELTSVNRIEYLSYNLKERDTIFLKKQIEQNKTFDLKILSKYNYQILNTSELLKKGVSKDSLSSIAYEKTHPSDRINGESYFLIGKPIFNKKKNRVCFSLNRPKSGEDFVLVRRNGKWKKTSIISRWAY